MIGTLDVVVRMVCEEFLVPRALNPQPLQQLLRADGAWLGEHL